MSKITHIERIRRQNASLKDKVLLVLGWHRNDYALFQYEMGCAYIAYRFPNDKLAKRMAEHELFWSWWRLHWAKRDKVFVDMLDLLFEDELESYYRDLHDPRHMQFTIHAKALEENYEEMVSQLIKNALK